MQECRAIEIHLQTFLCLYHTHLSPVSISFIPLFPLKISNSALWEVEQGDHSMETLGKYTETCLLVRWQSLIYDYTFLSLLLSLSLS